MPSREDMIAKVQALWAQADHPNTSPIEAATFRMKATDLMAKYQIDEIVLAEAQGGEEAITFVMVRLDTNPPSALVPDERMILMHIIAKAFDCCGIIKKTAGSANVETGKAIPGGTYYEIIGYKSDVDTARMLYFNLSTDLLMALMVEEQKSSEQYRRSFATGFAEKIGDRLRELRDVKESYAGEISSSFALAVRSRKDRVQDRFEEMYPERTKNVAVKKLHADWNGMERGKRRAENANLGQTGEVGGRDDRRSLSAAKKELGGGES